MSEILGIARLKIHDGKLEEFKNLQAKCLESVRTSDHGTLQYDLFLNADESEGVALERYRDSDALLEHLANLGDLMGTLLETCSISGELLGHLGPELRTALEAAGVGIYLPYHSL